MVLEIKWKLTEYYKLGDEHEEITEQLKYETNESTVRALMHRVKEIVEERKTLYKELTHNGVNVAA